MNLKTRDNGYEMYVELLKKNGSIAAGRTWSGNRLAKRPAWVKEIDPAV